jgi:crossover junction endodeoxyribonuclease RuvC
MFALAAGVLMTPPEAPTYARLAMLRADLKALVTDLHPQVVVVERVFFQTNARTAMAVGQASGVALLTAAEAGCEVVEYTSNEVKLAVAGHGSASKDQVQRMVARLLALPETPRPPDAADALALAICHLTTVPLRLATAAAIARAEPVRPEAAAYRAVSTTREALS